MLQGTTLPSPSLQDSPYHHADWCLLQFWCYLQESLLDHTSVRMALCLSHMCIPVPWFTINGFCVSEVETLQFHNSHPTFKNCKNAALLVMIR
jgi:hypothetical protein